MGFEAEKLALIAEPRAAVANALLQPFLKDEEFDLATWDLKDRFEALLGENRWWFRSAGPPTLLLLLRAFQGLVQQLEQLQVKINWWQILDSSVSPETRTLAVNVPLSPLPPEMANLTMTTNTPSGAAEHLRVVVIRDGEKVVEITMPGRAARNIQNLMPEDVLEQITAAGEIDMKAIRQRLEDTGLRPQEVFEFDNGEKQYRVWLE